jgi:hypothetical protein
MIKIRADELSKTNTMMFLRLLVKAGVLEMEWETHDGRMDRVWIYKDEKQTNEVNQEMCWYSEVSIPNMECHICDGTDLTCGGFISVREREALDNASM